MLVLTGFATNIYAQVSNDNEDRVYKVERPEAKDYVPGQVLVKLKDGQQAKVRRAAGKVQSAGIIALDKVLKDFGAEDMEQLLPNSKVKGTPRRSKAYNGEVIVERDLTQLYRVVLPEEKAMETMQLVEQLKTLDVVEFAEPNYKVYLMAEDHIADSYSGNALQSQQWYLDNYGVKELWNKPIINAERPIIAILDTGVDLTHPDLVDNLWTNQVEAEGEVNYDNDGNGFAGDVHGWDFINNTPNIRDNNMHGTHVAGIVAASNNNIGIVGANPLAYIMPVSVLQSDGSGDVATIIKGIDYAVANGATVLNLSLGTYAYSRAMRQALERAYQQAVIVAAAGNDGAEVEKISSYPAAFSFVLGVMAIDESGDLAPFSNFDITGPNFSNVSTLQDPDGVNYELMAPGTNILSTIPGGKYKMLNGTSMASPLVAGAISALKMVKQYDTQEILWGDLTHSLNIAGAYAITERPAELDLITIQWNSRKDLNDETEEDYSDDHRIDAGEIVSFYPVIRTTFGEASNIKIHLEMGDEFEDATMVEFQTGTVDFGMHLDAYGRGVSMNPLVFKVANNVSDNRHIKLKIVATCDESTETFEWPFVIVVDNMIKISGIIENDTKLTNDHTYFVVDDIAIAKGATLTIEPGTRLEFETGKGLYSFGKLVARGKPGQLIVMAPHISSTSWNGVVTHENQNGNGYATCYMNEDETIITLKQTDTTPIEHSTGYYDTRDVYYTEREFSDITYDEVTQFQLFKYLDFRDMTWRQEELTNPDFLTPAFTKMKNDFNEYVAKHQYDPDNGRTRQSIINCEIGSWNTYDNPRDTLYYCQLIDVGGQVGYYGSSAPAMHDCIISGSQGCYPQRCNFTGDSWSGTGSLVTSDEEIVKWNNYANLLYYESPNYSSLRLSNVVGSYIFNFRDGEGYLFQYDPSTPSIDHADYPSYLGSSREDLIRPHIWEMGNGGGFGKTDLSNMPTRPYAEAHGIVWKVVVNGKDAQDEYEDLPPLGVGKHKFEVYFNRPMNKAMAPKILFGVRDPYTQNTVDEDGSWNAEGTVYTAYKTIDGKTKSDGVNRIYVYGAEDNEYFECPYEKSRFNIQIQAAGSMATGFAAEAGMGKVNLVWNNDNNDFDDAMGFNIYRYNYIEKTIPAHYDESWNWIEETTVLAPDTIRLNTDIVDIETTSYTDYDVVPGTTYYYMYKVLSTDLQEYDVSNTVAATPLTATLGDANGSGSVDVADVITTVNYAAGMEPKPFIFEAADMNADTQIDILDVIGIIQKILNPSSPALVMSEAEAVYTIKDGILYVESPVALAGIQVQLNMDEQRDVTVASDLNGFEHTSAWLTDNDYLFLAYNMNGKTLPAGKHALLKIGDADITNLRLSDSHGHNVNVVAGTGTTAIDVMGSKVLLQGGVFNLKGQKVAGKADELQKLPKGIYIVNGEKVVR